MGAHTPGPWKMQDDADDALYIVGGGGTIAQVTSTQANARLIAAAPRMLEELQRMYEAARCMADPEHCLHEYRECLPWEELADKARAILRDVKGETK